MLTAAEIKSLLIDAFPSRTVDGPIAPHDCEECERLRDHLTGISWISVPDTFPIDNPWALPLLTPEAYTAYLPAWLRASITVPESDLAMALLVNLEAAETALGFTPNQVATILETARYLVEMGKFGPDVVAIEQLTNIETIWGPNAA